MVQIILVRHGQTQWNKEERFRGRADIDLDEVGVKQAEAAADWIADWPVSAIYSSPLRRAMTTAGILASKLDLEVKPLPGIIDLDFGKWQGMSAEEAIADDAELFNKWLYSPHEVTFPGGESLAEVRERAAAAVESVVAQYPDKTIVLVSHRAICKILILYLLGLDNSHFWQISQDVCAVNLFEIRDGVPSTLFLNDTCHLKGLN